MKNYSRWRAGLVLVFGALMSACGGGGSDPEPGVGPDRIVIVNRTQGLTLNRVLIEAFNGGDEYGAIDVVANIPPASSQALDQAKVDALLTNIPGQSVMDTFLFHGPNQLDFAGEDLGWLRGEGSFIVSVFRNVNFPGPGEDDEYILAKLTQAEYAKMLADAMPMALACSAI